MGILGLDLLLCEAYDCRTKLSKTSNTVEDRVYKVVPGNTDFEKPVIETIPVQNVQYNETLDQSNNVLAMFSHYFSNSDNVNCPIESCEIMENCDSTPSSFSTAKSSSASNPDIWAISN